MSVVQLRTTILKPKEEAEREKSSRIGYSSVPCRWSARKRHSPVTELSTSTTTNTRDVEFVVIVFDERKNYKNNNKFREHKTKVQSKSYLKQCVQKFHNQILPEESNPSSWMMRIKRGTTQKVTLRVLWCVARLTQGSDKNCCYRSSERFSIAS